MASYRIAALLILSTAAHAQPTPSWKLTRSNHFELYSQGDDAAARSALIWFEQLRVFYLRKTGLASETLRPVRVIAFRSAREYQPYQLRPASDAHYVGTESRDYIVMAAVDTGIFKTAAHEYAHAILHAAGLQFPPWLSEGLAEFFSTVRINQRECTLGGDLPVRSQVLRRRPWIALENLLAMPANSPIRDNRETAAVFYSQSWALVDMLALSPQYAPRFSALITALSSTTQGPEALPRIYGKSLSAITGDLHAWAAIQHQPVPLTGIPSDQILPQEVQASVDLTPLQARALLAEMLLAAGDLVRAGAIYNDLAAEMPRDPSVPAALGNIALREGNNDRAREQWQRAIALGIQDATLCFQYAVLGGRAGVPDQELRPALERAIQLQPDFDDARYSLALLEKNAGHYEAAVAQLRAMRNIAPARAYNYWLALADALVQLGQRDQAGAASKKAAEQAATAAERARAAQLAYFADTDLAVQFTLGENGRAELQTTRVPHRTADGFNPFIQPGDKMRHAEGVLREVDCSAAATRFVIHTSNGIVSVAIPDPGHVQMRNAPSEFTCGPQPASKVSVDYAESASSGSNADGVARGIQFR